MVFAIMSGVHLISPSRILPFDLNSVGAPNATPIICPAQPPRILSSSTARLILRGASAAPATAAAEPQERDCRREP